MQNLVPLGMYELVTNHLPPPVGPLIERLSSPYARRTYQAVAEHFLGWIERDPFETDANVVSNYKAEMLIYNRPSLVALRLRIVVELYDQAISLGMTQRNPAINVPPPHYTPDEPCVPPSPDEARAHLSPCSHAREACKRDRALCRLIIDADISPEDVKGLRVQDFSHQGSHGILTIGGSSSNNARRVELPEPTSSSIDEYLAGREVADDSLLFAYPPFGFSARASPCLSPGADDASYDKGLAG